MTALAPIETFIARWQSAGGSERANYQLFITELCELLDLPKPEPAQDDARDNAYVFERRVVFKHGDGSTSNGFIDCYRRAEEAQGHIRWLRPAFQAPEQTQTPMAGLEEFRQTICGSHEQGEVPPALPAPTQQWPATLPEQMSALANVLNATPQSDTEIAARFAGKGKWKTKLPELLATLATLGRARQLEDGRWMG